MEGIRGSNGPEVGSSAATPNYTAGRAVREALQHLASIHPFELCTEAKTERCRAARDLRSCGRIVLNVLNSCGHASLCDECSQRFDMCPVCRVPIPMTGYRVRRRLYSECVEAGLITKRCDERFQEVEDEGKVKPAVDVQRLYSFFDVALENGLVDLIRQYITDVCMDEGAVSSDPVTAVLLDEVVVKEWCIRAFQNIFVELREIYILDVQTMKSKLVLLRKYLQQLHEISDVLEVLDSSFRNRISPQLDFDRLHDRVMKTEQHIEVMIWCIGHDFLENARANYDDYNSWRNRFHERRSEATKRAWPDAVKQSVDGSLFIEDALNNICIHGDQNIQIEDGFDLSLLERDGSSPMITSTVAGNSWCYPFKDLRAAVDKLFLYGSSDLVVAKRAILLYYLYDRHWTLRDEEWRDIADSFAAMFGINKVSLLESLIFYLLDDNAVDSLEEACRLLPEISSPSTHPKIAQVLLERQMPDTGLMALRWTGHDNSLRLLSLSEAVTAIRVRVECGLLTEAFNYQKMLCDKVREKKNRNLHCADSPEDEKDECVTWVEWMETLVTEICLLCIRRKLVDRMIELPWDSDEEKYIHNFLLDYASSDPSTIIGSLLVVFYLQRFRYFEAHKVDRDLHSIEQETKSSTDVSEEVLFKMQAASNWRATLLDACSELLPQLQRQQLKSGKFLETGISSATQAEMPEMASHEQGPIPTSFFLSLTDSSPLLGNASTSPSSDPVVFETPIKSNLPADSQEWLYTKNVGGLKLQVGTGKSFKFDENMTPTTNSARFPLTLGSIKRSSPDYHLSESSPNHKSPELEQDEFFDQLRRPRPLYPKKTPTVGNSRTTPRINRKMLSNSTIETDKNVSSKRVHSDTNTKPWDMDHSEDPMDISWSGVKTTAVDDQNQAVAPRWRSDEVSDNEEEDGLIPQRSASGAPHITQARKGVRRGRFMIR